MNWSSEHRPTDEISKVTDSELVDNLDARQESSTGKGWKIQLGLFCLMLLLALLGMGLTQSLESGAWEYWLFVVFVYAAIGVWKRVRGDRQRGLPVYKGIVSELSHWGTLVGFLAVLLFLERRQVVDRESASHFALMLLALSCFLAGVHLDWQLLLMGVVLTIMLVSVALLEQDEIVLWVIMIGAAGLAAGFFYVKTREPAAPITKNE